MSKHEPSEGDDASSAKIALTIRRSLPHGHVAAALATARRIGLHDLLPRRGKPRLLRLALALIAARLLDPAAKPATAHIGVIDT